jgi:hypothetical protein
VAGKRKSRYVDPTRQPSDVDIAWIAGLYEGEGTCWDTGKGQITCGIYQKDPEILYWCLEMFGGSISQMRHRTPDKVCNVWNLNGDNARVFLQVIYPFMSARRKVQIDRTSFRKFTGVVRETRPEMSEERKASRALMTATQKKQESKEQWIARNRERYLANMRLAQRRKYVKLRNQGEADVVVIQ